MNRTVSRTRHAIPFPANFLHDGRSKAHRGSVYRAIDTRKAPLKEDDRDQGGSSSGFLSRRRLPPGLPGPLSAGFASVHEQTLYRCFPDVPQACGILSAFFPQLAKRADKRMTNRPSQPQRRRFLKSSWGPAHSLRHLLSETPIRGDYRKEDRADCRVRRIRSSHRRCRCRKSREADSRLEKATDAGAIRNHSGKHGTERPGSGKCANNPPDGLYSYVVAGP